MKERQKEFAKTLASYADVYVNDAFGTAHRKHASTAVVADYFDADHKMLGYLMEKEVKAVKSALLTKSSAISSVLSPLSWAVRKFRQRSESSRTSWTKSTTLSSAAA